jgi:transposase-like protein
VLRDQRAPAGARLIESAAQRLAGLAALPRAAQSRPQLDKRAGELELPAIPLRARKRIRTTNLLERTFVEVRRRTKVIGRFPGETSALSLIWAVLELSSRAWRGVRMSPKTSRRSNDFARSSPPRIPHRPEEVIAA